jgi:CRP-like cAMP-binding protein
MAANGTDRTTPRNRILAALPREEWERIGPQLERVRLGFREVVCEPNRPMSHVYFPEDGIVSILGLMDDGSAVETATVGNEGMVGVPVFLGAMQMAGQAFAQIAGDAWRMPAAALREEVRRGSPLSALLGRYTQALFTLVAQSSACNRKHPVEQRCARWLLMSHDRVGGDSVPLTQLFLSQMLGVRRATVNEAATALQERGLIEYRRGLITILDRPGLEAAACACYAIIRAEFARMLEHRELPDPLADLDVSANGLSTAGDGSPITDNGGGDDTDDLSR